MPPKGTSKEKLAEVQSRAALKPGGVSYAPDWATSSGKDDGGEFQTVKKKGGNRPPQQKPAAVVGAVREVRAPPPPPSKPRAAGGVLGAEVVVPTKQKPAPKPKQKPAPKPAAADVPEESSWQTISKKPKAQQQQQQQQHKSDRHIQGEIKAQQRRNIQKQNAGVVGAAPADSEADKKREAKEAKKRAKEMEKQRLALAAKKAEQHADPNDDAGFVTVAKGAKPVKGKSNIESFGNQTAFSKLQRQGDNHKKVPKQQKAREVTAVTEEDRQRIIREQHEKLTSKPADVIIDFRVQVQGKWYPIKSLLEANNFEHAPKMVRAAAMQEKFVGGFFISSSEDKYWANEHTVDETWMATTYLQGVTKMLESKEQTKVTPYWATKGQDATATMEINRPTLQSGCYPTFNLVHVQKHPAQLQTLAPSVHQFAEALLAETRSLEDFLHRVDLAADGLSETKKFQDAAGKKKLADFRTKLPSKVEQLRQNLEYAFQEFCEAHPLPAPKEQPEADGDEEEDEEEGEGEE